MNEERLQVHYTEDLALAAYAHMQGCAVEVSQNGPGHAEFKIVLIDRYEDLQEVSNEFLNSPFYFFDTCLRRLKKASYPQDGRRKRR
jgi:hypothetical protein